MMFEFFERCISPTETSTPAHPPGRLVSFYWFFLHQIRWHYSLLLVIGFVVALLDASIPVFIGQVVSMLSSEPPISFFSDNLLTLLGMGFVLLILRPTCVFVQSLISNQIITPSFTSLIMWQSHCHIFRQDLSFFQDDFAGRLANRVMNTGVALRESSVMSVTAIWYISVYGVISLILLTDSNLYLAAPTLIWLLTYILLIFYFVPRIKKSSMQLSEARSVMAGRIVDSYTNISTVKLFVQSDQEDKYVREAVDRHTEVLRSQVRLTTLFTFYLVVTNAVLVASSSAIAIILWRVGIVEIGDVGMVLPLTWQITIIAGWVAQRATTIFESIGIVQEGMTSIAKPLRSKDNLGTRRLAVKNGAISFDHVTFNYGHTGDLIGNLNLDISAGEKIGIVGRSGAGKSTLVNLLLRFFDLECGRILIDNQDITGVTPESLREQIAVVTQDTSLLHRSVYENLRYGRPGATRSEVVAAAKYAHAHNFILDLMDWCGRRGYEAHVGERGVKLSGGQRQRIAIARAVLKDSPILILDEATSALDSEVEAGIQEQLNELMKGKTVIVIAHRLSTVVRMDRIVLLDRGQVVEMGSHDELLQVNGLYATLWRQQSGDFLGDVCTSE